jgi:hypothetical protein
LRCQAARMHPTDLPLSPAIFHEFPVSSVPAVAYV